MGDLEPYVPMMPGTERKAKLSPSDFVDARTAAPTPEGRARNARVLGSAARPIGQDRGPPQTASADAGSALAEPLASESAMGEENAAKQALAADLEDMIGGMLRSTQFATAAMPKTRSRNRIGEVVALDATTDASAFTPSSLVADLARSRPAHAAAAAQPAAQRHRWIDAVLVLACVLSVVSAGYFVLSP